MANNTSSKTPKSEQTRTVYEVWTSKGGARQVEASSTTELKHLLGRLLPELEPYAAQAVARLVSIERATVSAGDWRVKRLGVMQFQPDEPVQKEGSLGARPPRKLAAEKSGGQTTALPAAQPAHVVKAAAPQSPPAVQARSTSEPLFEDRLLDVE